MCSLCLALAQWPWAISRHLVNVRSCGFGSEVDIAFLSHVCVLEELKLLNHFLWADFNFEGKVTSWCLLFSFLQMTGSFFRKISCKCDMLKERVLKLQEVEK